MDKKVEIRVADIIGSNLCISEEDGQRVYEKIVFLLEKGTPMIVSFEFINMIVSLFLNVSIGQLFGKYSESALNEMIEFKGLSEDDSVLLELVIKNAKKYYSNQRNYDEAWEKVSEEDEE